MSEKIQAMHHILYGEFPLTEPVCAVFESRQEPDPDLLHSFLSQTHTHTLITKEVFW